MSLRPSVLLVADRTLSAGYKVLFEGIFATMQTTKVPGALMRRVLSPPAGVDADGRALTAPLGLRRVEAALLAAGLSSDEVVVTTPEALPRLLGPHVRLVGVSSSDPLGRGMSNTTTSRFWSGRLYTAEWTERLMGLLAEARRQFGFRVVFGGAGAWQYAQDMDQARRHGIDTVFEGYFERQGPALVAELLTRREAPPHVVEGGICVDAVRPIARASGMGVIELSRGCGNGCRFCLMAGRAMAHLPEDLILADAATNARSGVASLVSSSEDFFRYGAAGRRVNFDALQSLLERLRQIEGLSFMQIDHANISSVLQLEPAQLAELRRLLSWRAPTRYLWVNLGVESANGRLVAANAPGKIAPFDPDDWEELVLDSARRLTQAGFFPTYSLILGLPGETPDDVRRTIALVQRLAQSPVVVFPVFHEPVRADARAAGEAFTLEKMTPAHLELYRLCYELNFRQVPRLFWDNQRAGGVGWAKRAFLQVLGWGEIVTWRRNFRRVQRRLAARK